MMSMLKLLNSGQTLRAMGNRPNAYKMPARAALPKFAPMNRPITLSPAAKADRVLAQASLFESSLPKVPAPVSVLTNDTFSAPSLAQKVQIVRTDTKASLWQRMGAMGQAFVRQIFLGQKPRPAHGATVQTELALAKVMPMRNDLSDADLEVVSAKVGTAAAGSSRGRAEATGEAWPHRIATRFSRRDNKTGKVAAVETVAAGVQVPDLITRD